LPIGRQSIFGYERITAQQQLDENRVDGRVRPKVSPFQSLADARGVYGSNLRAEHARKPIVVDEQFMCELFLND
jgi:hypothetical protein